MKKPCYINVNLWVGDSGHYSYKYDCETRAEGKRLHKFLRSIGTRLKPNYLPNVLLIDKNTEEVICW